MGFRNFDEQRDRDANLATMFKSLGEAEGNWGQAGMIANKSLPWIRKGAVGGTDSSDMAGSFQHLVAGAFLLSLENGPSVFDTIRPMTRQAKFNTPIFISSAPLIAKVTAESTAIPAVKYAVDSAGLIPTKVAGIAVATNESLRTLEGAEALQKELLQAVSLATDVKFLSDLASSAGTIEISATFVADPVSDLKKLLEGVNLTGYGSLYWVCGPAVANILSTWRTTADAPLLFPEMTPVGGQILGLPALVSPAMLSDRMMLINASAVCTGSSELELRTTTSAMLEMASNPAMDSATPAGVGSEGDDPAVPHALVSLFQVDATGVLGIRSFASKLVRTSGVALLTGIAWGEEES